jgi:hypothetical protein
MQTAKYCWRMKRRNNCFRRVEADPEARVADKVMPTLPISIMNVMDGMRGNQEMIVSGESNVDETATPPLDYVVSGAQLLTVTVK